MSEARTQNIKTPRDESTAQAAASAARKGAEAAGQQGRAAVDALRRGGEASAQAFDRARESGAEVLRRSTEAAFETQRQVAQGAAERMEELSRSLLETVRGTAEDLRVWASLPTVSDRALGELQQSFTGLVEAVVQSNLRATEEFVRLSSPAVFFELQHRFVREQMGAFMEGSAAVVRAMRQTADQSLPTLEQHVRQRRQAQASGASYEAQGYRTAAE